MRNPGYIRGARGFGLASVIGLAVFLSALQVVPPLIPGLGLLARLVVIPGLLPASLTVGALGADMPDNRWVGFVVQQDRGACGDIVLPDGSQVPGDTCGYHLVKEWISGPGGTLLRDEQVGHRSHFKIACAAL